MTTASQDNALTVVRQFQSETDAIREARDPIGVRATMWILVVGLLALLAVSFVARVDRVISSASGKVVTTETPVVFQALDPSIIKTIDVREGDIVQSGQLLATLDPTFAAADVEQLRQQIAGLKAEIIRATAESNGKPLAFGPDDSGLGSYQALQQSLYDQRAAALQAQLKSFDEKIDQAKATIAKLQQDESRYQDHDKIAKQIEDMRAALQKSGSGSLLNLLTASDSRLEYLRQMEFDHNSLIEAQHTLSSIQADRESALQQWNATVAQEIVTAKTSLDQADAQMTKAAKHRDLVRLVAPEPSMVLTIAKLSVGSVLKEGDAFVTLAPLRSPLEAEVSILSRDIGYLRPGDPATIKIAAFDWAQHGDADGHVRWISEGSFTVDGNGQPTEPYYKARVAIDHLNFHDVPAGFRLIPGMTLTADVKIGTRSVFRYLMGGFIRGTGDAMREP